MLSTFSKVFFFLTEPDFPVYGRCVKDPKKKTETSDGRISMRVVKRGWRSNSARVYFNYFIERDIDPTWR